MKITAGMLYGAYQIVSRPTNLYELNRIVSWAEYKVLEEFIDEGKLDRSLYPKPEFAEEYFRRIYDKWNFKEFYQTHGNGD